MQSEPPSSGGIERALGDFLLSLGMDHGIWPPYQLVINDVAFNVTLTLSFPSAMKEGDQISMEWSYESIPRRES